MRPIYVVIYYECNDILPIGAFVCYQDAVDAMKEDNDERAHVYGT